MPCQRTLRLILQACQERPTAHAASSCSLPSLCTTNVARSRLLLLGELARGALVQPARARVRRPAADAQAPRRPPRWSRRRARPGRPRTAAAPRPRRPAAPAAAARALQPVGDRGPTSGHTRPSSHARSSAARTPAARAPRGPPRPRRHLGAEACHHRVAQLLTFVELVDDLVAGDHLRAEPAAAPQRGRLARAHAAGQADERHRRARTGREPAPSGVSPAVPTRP